MYLKINHSCNQIFDDKHKVLKEMYMFSRVHFLLRTKVHAAAMTSAFRTRDVDDATTRGVTPE